MPSSQAECHYLYQSSFHVAKALAQSCRQPNSAIARRIAKGDAVDKISEEFQYAVRDLNNRVGVGYSAAVARFGVASARLLSFRSILVTHWPNCIELNPSSSRFQSSVVSGVRRRTTECEAARLGPRLCRGPVARRFELTDDHRPKRGGFASPPVTFQSFCAE